MCITIGSSRFQQTIRQVLLGFALLLIGVECRAQFPVPGQCELLRIIQERTTPLSACISALRDVEIGQGNCTHVHVDKSYTGADALRNIKVNAAGKLFVPDRTLTVEAATIAVQGLLEAGTAQCPIGEIQPDSTATTSASRSTRPAI